MKISILLVAFWFQSFLGAMPDSLSSLSSDSNKLQNSSDSIISNAKIPAKKKAVIIPVENEIDPGLTTFLKRAIADAELQKPDYIIFKINTFGGRLDAAFEIVELITSVKSCSTIAYVEQKAISAGALISLACNRIAMGKSTTIGDCAPIIQGQEGIVMAGEKIESPLRAKFRNLAERNSYPILLAQAMVSKDMEIIEVHHQGQLKLYTQKEWEHFTDDEKKAFDSSRTLVSEGELLTLTDTEAKELGFSVGSFESLDDYLKSKDLDVEQRIAATWSESLVRTIGKFAPMLMLIGFGALYMEFKTPGFGLFGSIGIICLLIVFGSKYAAGLADYTEALILGLGVLCLVIEMFVMPGTLIFGGLGLMLIVASMILSFQSFTLPDPELPWQGKLFLKNIGYVLGVALGGLLFPIFGAKFILPRFSGNYKLITTETLAGAKSASVMDGHPSLEIGQKGTAKTTMRPFGKILVGDEVYEAQCESGFIEAGTSVEISLATPSKIMVRASR